MPDAVSFATRLALAMLLAYYVSFSIQLASASSAGVCVGIVLQPSPGMAISKAFYRTLGTLAGGAAALLIGALFPQDRTMLLLAIAAWLACCTFVASLLRDFRAYGAVLAGYTAAIICVGQIDAPANLLLTTLDRVAAILIGILCVALVNAVFIVASAHAHLLAELRRQLDDARSTALAVLGAGARPLRDVSLARAADLLALRTDAAYASAELADGLRRNHAATAAVAALLDMLAASRELGRALASVPEVSPDARTFLDAAAESLRAGTPPAPIPVPAALPDALITERAASLLRDHTRARRAIDATETGVLDGLPPHSAIPSDPDMEAAVLNAARAAIASGLGGVLCVVGNDPTTTLLLIQLSAFVALLGLQPNPSASAAAFLPGLLPAAGLAGAVAFVLLPSSSGFVPFALAVGPAAFLLGLVARHPATAGYGPAMLIYFTILLSPSNVEAFSLPAFVNLVLQLAVATVLTILAFRFILPVSPRRRLLRIADKVVRSLQHALRDGGAAQGRNRSDRQPSLAYDRLAQAQQWAKARQDGPQPVLTRLCLFAELDAAACRATRALREAVTRASALQPLSQAARAGLAQADPDRIDDAARQLLASAAASAAPDAVLRAVSGLHAAALLIRGQGFALVRYGVTGA